MKVAVIIYGPPGSGKGTQANLLANFFGLIHFDTGKYLESVVHDPKNSKNPDIQKERYHFDIGILVTPSFTLKIVKSKVKKIAKSDYGIVFSGSPRTLFEAKGLIPMVECIYGKKNIIPFVLKISESTSIRRNSSRLVCELCENTIIKTLLPKKFNLRACPVCGSKLRRRTLDNPKVIKVRLREYRERTKPIFAFLEKRGYVLHKINGEKSPKKVLRDIRRIVSKHSEK